MGCFGFRFLGRTAFCVFVLVGMGHVRSAWGTALDDYVSAADGHYGFEVVRTFEGAGYRASVIDLTSQQWRTADEVDRPIWHHWLTIIIPDSAKGGTGFLWIDGGRNGGEGPDSADDLLGTVATQTGSVIVILEQVPNQRLKFSDEQDERYVEGGRTEDEILAYSFHKFFETGDPTWPVLLPMVKSVVRAMDTAQTFVAAATNGRVVVDDFVVSGGSKRGWTTWLTGAVDGRVRAIAPAVIDMLNLDEQLVHHLGAYGFFSPAVQDYVDLGIFDRLGSGAGQALLGIVDPYEYRDRFAEIPKYLVNSTGDEFFLPDSAQFYFAELPGEKYLRYVPNTSHGIDDPDALAGVLTFYQSILKGSARPHFSWTMLSDGSICVHTTSIPIGVKLWQATNGSSRNFMKAEIGEAWTSRSLQPESFGVYVGRVAPPAEGWTAFMVELVFLSGNLIPHTFTTPVRVVPDVLAFGEDGVSVEPIAEACEPGCGIGLCGAGSVGTASFMMLGWLGMKVGRRRQ